jgi:hypothetical protein
LLDPLVPADDDVADRTAPTMSCTSLPSPETPARRQTSVTVPFRVPRLSERMRQAPSMTRPDDPVAVVEKAALPSGSTAAVTGEKRKLVP